MDKGALVDEYNMMIIERYIARSSLIAARKHRIAVTTMLHSAQLLSAADVLVKADGEEVARTTVARTVTAAFPSSETSDVGVDLGATVSLDDMAHRPLRFDSKLTSVKGLSNT